MPTPAGIDTPRSPQLFVARSAPEMPVIEPPVPADPVPVTARCPLDPVLKSTMPLLPPLAEMLRKVMWFEPMVVLTTLNAVPVVEERMLGEFVPSLVVYSTELLVLLAPMISTAFPPAEVTLTSLIVSRLPLVPAVRLDVVRPFVAPALVLMFRPSTMVFSFIVTVPRMVGLIPLAVVALLLSVGRVMVPAGGVMPKKLSKLEATVP